MAPPAKEELSKSNYKEEFSLGEGRKSDAKETPVVRQTQGKKESRIYTK